MKDNYIKIITLVLLALNAAAWIVFSFFYFFVVDQPNVLRETEIIVSLLLFIDGIFYITAIAGIIKRIKAIYIFSLILVLGNALLSICDETGIADISMCVLNIIIFVLLFMQRKNIFKKRVADEKS